MENKEQFILVKFESTNKAYTFKSDDTSLKDGDPVIVETQRGIELGRIHGDFFTSYNTDKEVNGIIRKATDEDLKDYEENKETAKEAMQVAQEESDKLHLDMKYVASEYTLDREKITLSYLADERVDFRELLKVLAAIFCCRIELRQIGPREKAKMVSGIGQCGRRICCSNNINIQGKISINMAKNQGLALNTQKFSGQCGNLLCCLKYEDDLYTEAKKNLPAVNSTVEFENELYTLASLNIISKTCKLQNENRAIFIPLEDLLKRGKYEIAKEETRND